MRDQDTPLGVFAETVQIPQVCVQVGNTERERERERESGEKRTQKRTSERVTRDVLRIRAVEFQAVIAIER
jgi:hypothetical protein